jgi:hypothetical protein
MLCPTAQRTSSLATFLRRRPVVNRKIALWRWTPLSLLNPVRISGSERLCLDLNGVASWFLPFTESLSREKLASLKEPLFALSRSWITFLVARCPDYFVYPFGSNTRLFCIEEACWKLCSLSSERRAPAFEKGAALDWEFASRLYYRVRTPELRRTSD